MEITLKCLSISKVSVKYRREDIIILPGETSMPKTETIFVREIVNSIHHYLKDEPHYVQKLHGSAASSGLPDMVLIARGQTIFIEFKIHPNKLSPLQKAVIDKINQSGGVATMISKISSKKATCGMLTLDRLHGGYWTINQLFDAIRAKRKEAVK